MTKKRIRTNKKITVTIDELERLLREDEDASIEILPNGQIRRLKTTKGPKQNRPLTYRENLGGEYS